METFTRTLKSAWLKCLKEFYTLAKIYFREPWPIKRLQSDYSLEF